MSKQHTFLLALFLSIYIATPSNAAPLSNGDFSAGLSSWTATSGVTSTASQEAELRDLEFIVQLSQGFDTPLLPFTLEFDFLNILAFTSFPNDPFAFQDTVFATLYFVEDLGAFDLNAPAGFTAVELLAADYSGATADPSSLSPSATKLGWQHFSVDIDPTALLGTYASVLIAFELFDLDAIAGNSSFLVDNVQVTEVPEPASLALLGVGALFGGLRRRKVRN